MARYLAAARYPHKACATCGKPIEAGAEIYWDKGLRKTWHAACYQQPAPTPTQDAPMPAPTPKRDDVPAPVTRALEGGMVEVNHPAISGRVWRVEHASLTDYSQSRPSPKNEDMMARQLNLTNDNWRFGMGVTHAMYEARLRDGWQDGAARVSEIATREVKAPTSVRRARVWGEDGDSLDIHKVNRGQLSQAWERMTRQSKRAPRVVRIVPMVAGACGNDEKEFFFRGAAVVKLADLLATAGYAVEIIAGCVGSNLTYGSIHWAHAVTLKAAGAPLDINALAAALCQSGMHRYTGFRAMAAYPHARISQTFCVNRAPELNALLRVAVPPEDGAAHTFYLGYEVNSAAKAGEWVEQCIQTFEGEQT